MGLDTYLAGLPETYFPKDGPLTVFVAKIKGLLMLLGELPFMRKSTVNHLTALGDDKCPLCKKLKEIQWAKNLLGSAWLLNSGEKIAWPEVEATLVKLNCETCPATADAGVNEASAGYAKWKCQLRATALPVALHKSVLDICEKRVSEAGITGSEDDVLNAEDGNLVELLGYVRKASTLWTDTRMVLLLQKLHRFAAKASQSKATKTFIAACNKC